MGSHRLPARRRSVAVFIASVAVLTLQIGVLSPAGAAPASSISGRVVATTGGPLADICVNAIDDDGGYLDGTLTAPDGTYSLALAAGVGFRVQFRDCSDDPTRVEQWYPSQAESDSAEPITLGDAQERSGVDASLALGGTISGTVRTTSGDAVDDLCVVAVAGEGDSLRSVGMVFSASDGIYTLGSLPAGAIRILFEDCNDTGPYLDQWFDGAATLGAATAVDVTEGSVHTAVDATLERASVVNGTVTGPDGDPLSEVCVQAVGADRIGGSARTEGDGSYTLKLVASGTFRVQFVDCDGDPTHAGTWFGGGADPSTARSIDVPAQGEVSNIDAQLGLGAAAALSGTATNIRGDAMTTACAVLYLADEFVDFRPVEPDGSFEFDQFGSGTYAVAFIGCGDEDDDEDAQMLVPDPGGSGVVYDAVWRGGQTLSIGDDDAPDPIQQEAELLTVPAGAAATVDQCFGCDAISLSLAAGEESIAASFTTSGISLAGPMSLAEASDGLDYSLSCRADGIGASSEATAVAGVASPLVATGLDAGTGYTCSMSATSEGLLVAGSAVLGVSTTAAPTAPSSPSEAPATTVGSRPTGGTATPRSLSFAG